jgi:anaerobic nitric oxide reductase transcription regulator
MHFTAETLAGLAVDIQKGLPGQDRFLRMIQSIHQLLECDATALLRYEARQFRPLATAGLAPDVMGRRFSLEAHPRLEAIARAGDVVRFPAESDLPDPYDGLIPDQLELHVHACIGMPLFAGQTLIGALTLDGINESQFDDISDDALRGIASLAGSALNNALLMEQLEKSAPPSSQSLDVSDNTHPVEMIGDSASLVHLKKEIAVVAPSDLSVLILGETGVGKELVAQSLHRQSSRAGNALVYLNCAALPESVAESELFGHVKGAFTGAIHDRRGKFEIADNGTLFLDEIGELSLPLQAKLLRVLQYGDLQRVGEDKLLKVDVRIIAATNKDLPMAITEGHFRADLYHRLSVFPLYVPPLRERGDDIILLAGYFCEKCRVKFGLAQISLSAEARHFVLSGHWPGNIRELEHAIYRAIIIARSESRLTSIILHPRHFALVGKAQSISATPVTRFPKVESLQAATRKFQQDYIRQAYANAGNRWAACARALEMDPGNLHRLAKKLGLK